MANFTAASAQISSNPLPNTTMITTWNSVLNETAKNFSVSHPGTTVMVFDAYNWLTYVFDNAADFGITNTTSFCSAYGNWDIATNYAAYVPLKAHNPTSPEGA